ncbi:MAG: phosphoglycerate dehydrogenase [Candidatus Omnitrophica bacterium]|nr:phosphoglycerate dehydrogenase [Candidatus Omnitrophota bacterium]
MKVLVSDKLGTKGISILEECKELVVEEKTGLSPDELKKIIGDYDGIVIRSATKLKADILEHANKMKVIGRAGVGVDNVDLPTATKKGIIVMNTPEGNTVSTCEHAFSMMMSLSRNIPQAHANVKSGKWDKNKFSGQELLGKMLGVIGFGRIGREFAKRAQAFGMKVIAYDPFITKEFADQFGAESVTLEELCKRADYITLHIPLTPETKYILNKKMFDLMKPNVRIINCSRGGTICEADLIEALKAGKIKGVATDVFEKEPPAGSPLLEFDNVVVTPHLGASTPEAQENVAIAVAEQVRDALIGKEIRNAVNMPSLDAESAKVLRPWVNLSEKLGAFIAQVLEGSVTKVSVQYCGVVTNYNLAPLTIAVLKGLLTVAMGDMVNFVNAPVLAKERGIEVVESKSSQLEDFANHISVIVSTDKGKCQVVGTLFGKKDPRIVKINDYHLDAHAEGNMIYLENEDKPGVIGDVCVLFGKKNVNIAEMALGRIKQGGTAITLFNVDQEVTAEVVKEIKALSKILSVKKVHL